MRDRPLVGLALGGGAARALAHVGALRVLEAEGLAPSALAGTSFGALIAALYALGERAADLERRLDYRSAPNFWGQVLDPGLSRASLVGGERFLSWLEQEYFHGATFGDLVLPLTITCTDTDTGELVRLRSGSLAKAVVASCALPGIIASVVWDGRYLVDGGLVATLPFGALEDGAELLIGVHAGIRSEGSRTLEALRRWHRSGPGQLCYRRLQTVGGRGAWPSLFRGLACTQASYEQRICAPEGALLICTDPPLSWWDFHKAPAAFAAGERATRKALASWRELSGAQGANH